MSIESLTMSFYQVKLHNDDIDELSGLFDQVKIKSDIEYEGEIRYMASLELYDLTDLINEDSYYLSIYEKYETNFIKMFLKRYDIEYYSEDTLEAIFIEFLKMYKNGYFSSNENI